jgi:predicted PurR-regulated permease PerM
MSSESRKITINITSGTIVKAILLILLFFAIYLFRDLLLIILTAIVIASAIEPIAQRLQKVGIPRLPSVILIYLALAGFFAFIFYFFIPPLFKELSSFLTNLPQFVDTVDFWTPINQKDLGIFQPAVQDISQSFSLREFIAGPQSLIGNAAEGFWKTISIFFGGALSFILIVVLSFYLAVQENGISNFLRIVTPADTQRYIIDLWKRAQRKIALWMQGQIVLAVLIAILVYLGLAILDVRFAFLLAVLAGLFELIPLFGPILAAIPAIAIAFVDGGLTLGLIVTGLYIIIQQFENHLIFPLVVKKVTGLPAIFVIISLIIGVKLAGFLGLILSVPIATILMELVNDFKKENEKILEKQVMSEAK